LNLEAEETPESVNFYTTKFNLPLPVMERGRDGNWLTQSTKVGFLPSDVNGGNLLFFCSSRRGSV
jgi:hypothetical protein